MHRKLLYSLPKSCFSKSLSSVAWSIYLTIYCLFNTVNLACLNAEENSGERKAIEKHIVTFVPPQGWRYADKKILPDHVQVMVVGKGKSAYPPSINLATEEYSGTLDGYLKIVKKINDVPGSNWSVVGTITTKAGEANLSQVESLTEWGEVKMMHTILNKDGVIYIMTASALKSEFPFFYKEFFASMHSLQIEGK